MVWQTEEFCQPLNKHSSYIYVRVNIENQEPSEITSKYWKLLSHKEILKVSDISVSILEFNEEKTVNFENVSHHCYNKVLQCFSWKMFEFFVELQV